MVTNSIFLSYWNGFACNQVGYKWLHWLQGVQGGSSGIFFGLKGSTLSLIPYDPKKTDQTGSKGSKY